MSGANQKPGTRRYAVLISHRYQWVPRKRKWLNRFEYQTLDGPIEFCQYSKTPPTPREIWTEMQKFQRFNVRFDVARKAKNAVHEEQKIHLHGLGVLL